MKRLLKDYFSDLTKAGIMPFAISHTSVKSIKEKGDDTEGYNILTSNLSNDVESIFGDIFDCVLTGYIDRSVDANKNIIDETRKLYFRGNSFIDAGCRFSADSVPEYIVFNKPNMAKDFIDVLETGLKNSRTVKISDEDFAKEQKIEREQLENKAKEFSTEQKKKQEDSPEVKQEKLDKIKSNMSNLDMTKLQTIMTNHNIKDFTDVNAIPMVALDEILALI